MRDEPEWNQLQEEHNKNRTLTRMEREIWNAEMKVKIKLAKDLRMEVTAKMAQKNFTRFKAADYFSLLPTQQVNIQKSSLIILVAHMNVELSPLLRRPIWIELGR